MDPRLLHHLNDLDLLRRTAREGGGFGNSKVRFFCSLLFQRKKECKWKDTQKGSTDLLAPFGESRPRGMPSS